MDANRVLSLSRKCGYGKGKIKPLLLSSARALAEMSETYRDHLMDPESTPHRPIQATTRQGARLIELIENEECEKSGWWEFDA